MTFFDISKQIGEKLIKGIPKKWDAKKSILLMKDSNYPHWKQMEWIGFYFQFLCENLLSNLLDFPGPKYGNVKFDAFKVVPWDFKAHAINTINHQIILNDREAVVNGIKDYGVIGLIIALRIVKYNDEKRSFQIWHENLKGGLSDYSLQRIKRGAWSRLRKVSFDLKQISFIKISNATLDKCGSFQINFRNSSGNLRKSKVILDLEKLSEELEYFLEI